jgi:hypothetical protein
MECLVVLVVAVEVAHQVLLVLEHPDKVMLVVVEEVL